MHALLLRGIDPGLRDHDPRDALCGFEGVDEDEAPAYLETAYGAKTTTVDELVEAPAAAHVQEVAATRSAVALGGTATRSVYGADPTELARYSVTGRTNPARTSRRADATPRARGCLPEELMDALA